MKRNWLVKLRNINIKNTTMPQKNTLKSMQPYKNAIANTYKYEVKIN